MNPYLSPSRVRLEASSSSSSLSLPVWGARCAPGSKREARAELPLCRSPGGLLYVEEELHSNPRPGDKMSWHNSFDLALNSFVGGHMPGGRWQNPLFVHEDRAKRSELSSKV